MAEVIVATLNVSFNTDGTDTGADRGLIKLEIDDRPDGLNLGDTSFKPGEDVYYFMFKENVTLVAGSHVSTAGGISSAGSGSKTIDETVSFSNSDSGSLGYPPSSSPTLSWLGRCYEISESGQLVINTLLPERNGSNFTMAGGKKVIGVLKCRYTATGDLFKLSGVPTDFAEVMITAVGTTV